MRRSNRSFLLTAIVAGLLSAGGLHAQEPATGAPSAVLDPEADGATPLSPQTSVERLDALFAELKRQPDPRLARGVADRIWAEWRVSGSATADLLMQWANDAVGDERYNTALDLLDQVIVLKPDYAEGWNRRATVHFMMRNHGMSMSDIHRVLELEPRHFGALAGMAAILKDAGHDRLALDAYKRALDLYPADRTLQRQMSDLEEELAGDPV